MITKPFNAYPTQFCKALPSRAPKSPAAATKEKMKKNELNKCDICREPKEPLFRVFGLVGDHCYSLVCGDCLQIGLECFKREDLNPCFKCGTLLFLEFKWPEDALLFDQKAYCQLCYKLMIEDINLENIMHRAGYYPNGQPVKKPRRKNAATRSDRRI